MTDQLIWARQALTPGGWQSDVLVTVSTGGHIRAVTPGAAPAGKRVGVLLPAPANLHSHAFQRAMAGLTERRGPDAGNSGPADSFWTWRRLMYRFLDQLTPNDVEAITAFVQMEMLEAGFGASVEFHYLHHQADGAPYGDLGEMCARVAAAAGISGIGLTLLPVLYQQGGCDGRALGPGQIRFGNDVGRFARLHDAAARSVSTLPDDCRLGVAPHSLRAVSPAGLAAAAALGDGPIHMHLAEQCAEVEEVEQAYGLRPTEWLLENAAVDARWCLIHCTQMVPHETEALAATQAVAGLCPITESSLGDGIFDGKRYLEAGGRIGIGSDSNIRISLSDELRTLEYSQRLRDRSRVVLAGTDASTGRRIYEAAAHGGALAAGRDAGAIRTGALADLTALDSTDVNMIGRRGDTALDSYIFAGDDRLVSDVWSAGRHLVSNGRHRSHDQIEQAYRQTITRLKDVT